MKPSNCIVYACCGVIWWIGVTYNVIIPVAKWLWNSVVH